MAFRYQGLARRRALVAGLVGLTVVLVFGLELAVPALALVALVYYTHQLVAAAGGDEGVQYPSLAFVIVLNAIVVLLVQALLAFDSMRAA
jgi:hypothetical protein